MMVSTMMIAAFWWLSSVASVAVGAMAGRKLWGYDWDDHILAALVFVAFVNQGLHFALKALGQ